MRFLALVAKDARLVLRNRALLAALLAYPFLLALVLGAAFQEPPATMDLALVDRDGTGATVDVAGTPVGLDDLLASASPFARVREPATEAEALHLLREGEVDAVLVVPSGFMRQIAGLGANATLRVIVDESDPVRASLARSAVEGAIEAFVERIVQKKIDDVVELLRITVEGGTTRVAFVDVDVLGIDAAVARLRDVRAQHDPASAEARSLDEVITFLGFARQFLGDSDRYLTTTAIPLRVQSEGLTRERPSVASQALPGALVLGVFWTGSLAAALLSARERETGAHRRLAAAPSARFAQLASKAAVALFAALLPAAGVLALGLYALDAQVVDPALAVVALALSALAAAGLGALAAALARNTGGAALIAVLALVPLLLLGGLFYPIDYMPEAAQAAARIQPIALATDALRDAMLRGSPLVEAAIPLAGLLATALVLGAAAWTLGRRTT